MNYLDDITKTETGKKINDNKEKITKLAREENGQKVIGMLKSENVEEAIKKGDTKALKTAIERAMKTEEGSQLFAELSKLIKL